MKRLSDKGYVEAQYLLADAYSSGALDKIDNKEAFILFQSAAKHGHVESAFRTSFCYEEGLGTGRDSRKAVEFLKLPHQEIILLPCINWEFIHFMVEWVYLQMI